MNWKEFFDSIGLNGTKWQWRIMRWEKAWTERRETARQKKGQVTYRHKFCSCGALLDRDERVCPHCGARAPSWRAQVIRRAVGLVVPSALAVSTSILVFNSVMYLVLLARVGGSALFAPPLAALVDLGGLLLSELPNGAYPLLITYGYLHFGLIHFGFNMLVLSQVGPMLEQEIGKGRFFTLYTVALICGGLARYFWSGPSPTVVVGASGALFGLIGFGLSYAHAMGTSSSLAMRDFFARWAMYGFLFGFFIGADNVAHFGGFIAGLALGFSVERERIGREKWTPYWNAGAWIMLAATVISFAWVWLQLLGE